MTDTVETEPTAKQSRMQSKHGTGERTMTNDDAISRQAAIEVVHKYNESHMILKGKPIIGAASMMIELEDLPSVHPDIIACGDCKYYIPHDKRCGYWNHGVKPLMWCSQAERRWKE